MTLTPGSLVPWLGEAEIERVVFDGPSRVIDVGARRRLFRGALRRAIEVRDRTCFFPLCDEPPDRAEIDHIIEASKGGETTQTNGRLGCAFHNRRRNQHPDDWDEEAADLSNRLTVTRFSNLRPGRSRSGGAVPRTPRCLLIPGRPDNRVLPVGLVVTH